MIRPVVERWLSLVLPDGRRRVTMQVGLEERPKHWRPVFGNRARKGMRMRKTELTRKITRAVKSADRTFIVDGRDNRAITYVQRHLVPALADVGLAIQPIEPKDRKTAKPYRSSTWRRLRTGDARKSGRSKR